MVSDALACHGNREVRVLKVERGFGDLADRQRAAIRWIGRRGLRGRLGGRLG